MFEARVQAAPFDVTAVHDALARLGPHVGAIVTFTGQVRDEALFLEHYPVMAGRQLSALLDSARARWPLAGVVIVHRHGALEVGEAIVLVATASAHRQAAFESATYLMDQLKTRAPFWKRGAEGWVAARDSDDDSARRWEE